MSLTRPLKGAKSADDGKPAAPEGVARVGEGILGGALFRVEAADSTNDLALRLAARGTPEGTVVAADSQRRGRGRQSRAWHSPPGVNLHCSLILRPRRELRVWPTLSWVVAGAVARAVREEGVDAVRIKYPNDVVVRDLKVAGILLETRVGADLPAAVVAGIGMNVNLAVDDLPQELRGRAGSLRELLGRAVDRERLLTRVLRAVEDYYRVWQDQGPEAVRLRMRADGVGIWSPAQGARGVLETAPEPRENGA